jgi:hypothetical protein
MFVNCYSIVISMYKYTQLCVHISQWMYNLQTYTMMCTHITMDVQCTNIHNDVYTYHNGFTTLYIYCDICTHHCVYVYIVNPVWYVYTSLCICVHCKSIMICIHTIVYTFTLYIHCNMCTHNCVCLYICTMMCTHITMELQFTNIHTDVYYTGFTMYKHAQCCVHLSQWMYKHIQWWCIHTIVYVCTL